MDENGETYLYIYDFPQPAVHFFFVIIFPNEGLKDLGCFCWRSADVWVSGAGGGQMRCL